MANTIKIRRSAVANQAPTTSQLALGELAINTYDGKLFLKKDDGSASIVELSGGSGSVSTLQQVLTAGNSSTVDAKINGLTFGKGTSAIADNTAAGYEALYSNTTGDKNLACGYRALKANTFGDENVALGASAMSQGQGGSGNVAVGHESSYSLTTGYENVSVGQMSMNYCEDGYRNTAVGRISLANLIDGHNNVAVGEGAGFYIEGDNNTILGAYSGSAADSTLNSTVIISAGSTERARCDSSGDWSFPGELSFPDDKGVRFGDSDDMYIVHNSNINKIYGITSGLEIGTINNDVLLKPAASVELYENGSKKLETTATGITVTGNIDATSFVKSGGTSSQYLMADGSTSTGGGGGGGGVSTGKAIAMAMIFG